MAAGAAAGAEVQAGMNETRTRLGPRLAPLDTVWIPGTPAQLDHGGALRLTAALLRQTRKTLAARRPAPGQTTAEWVAEQAHEERFLHGRLFATIVGATTELSVEQARERMRPRIRRR